MKSLHITALGEFGGLVPRDRDGVVHLTADGWMASSEAPEGWYGEALVEWAEATLAEARERVGAAWQALDAKERAQ